MRFTFKGWPERRLTAVVNYLALVPSEPEAGSSQILLRVGWRTIVLAVVAALSVASPGSIWPEGMVAVAVVFLSGRPLKLRFDFPLVLALLFVAWMFLSTLWSIVPADTKYEAAVVFLFVVVFVGLRDGIRTRRHLVVVAGGYLVGCVVLIVRVIIFALTRSPDMATERLNLPDVNANYAGYAFALGIFMVLVACRGVPRSRVNIAVACGLTLILSAGIFLVDTRAALFGILLLVLWVAVSIWRRPSLVLLVAVVAIAGVLIAVGVVDKVSLIAESLLGRPTGTWSGRLTLWPRAREIWINHFFFGTGASTFKSQNVFGIGAHNIVLELGVGVGVIGVVLFFLLVYFSLRKQRQGLLVGAFVIVSAAISFTGQWEASFAGWVGLALASRLTLLAKSDSALWADEDQVGPSYG